MREARKIGHFLLQLSSLFSKYTESTFLVPGHRTEEVSWAGPTGHLQGGHPSSHFCLALLGSQMTCPLPGRILRFHNKVLGLTNVCLPSGTPNAALCQNVTSRLMSHHVLSPMSFPQAVHSLPLWWTKFAFEPLLCPCPIQGLATERESDSFACKLATAGETL